jgi:hypothetical protein
MTLLMSSALQARTSWTLLALVALLASAPALAQNNTAGNTPGELLFLLLFCMWRM